MTKKQFINLLNFKSKVMPFVVPYFTQQDLLFIVGGVVVKVWPPCINFKIWYLFFLVFGAWYVYDAVFVRRGHLFKHKPNADGNTFIEWPF